MEVIHNTQKEQFEIDLGDGFALAQYKLQGNDIYFFHTEVPEAHEGRGIASRLASTALAYAKTQGYTVHPYCSFFEAYIRRHPEYQEITHGYRKST